MNTLVKELNMELKPQTIDASLKRYELMEEYETQKLSKRKCKRLENEFKEEINKTKEEEIERLKNNPNIIKIIKVYKLNEFLSSFFLECDECNKTGYSKRIYAKLDFLIEGTSGKIIKQRKSIPLMEYCFNCGTIYKFTRFNH